MSLLTLQSVVSDTIWTTPFNATTNATAYALQTCWLADENQRWRYSSVTKRFVTFGYQLYVVIFMASGMENFRRDLYSLPFCVLSFLFESSNNLPFFSFNSYWNKKSQPCFNNNHGNFANFCKENVKKF